MSDRQLLLGLTPATQNLLSAGFSVVLVCLGIRIARASDVALKVANTQLVTSSSANRLEELARLLEEQAEVIKQKDRAYEELSQVYERSLRGKRGYEKLQSKIEAIKELPEVESIDKVINEIEATEEFLQESVGE